MTEFAISILLAIDPTLFPQVEDWLFTHTQTQTDVSPADLVLLRSRYSMAKDRTLGPSAPTVLVVPQVHLGSGLYVPSRWPTINGAPTTTVCHDAEQVAMSGDWLVSQDRKGRYSAFDLSERHPSLPSESSLDAVNDHLAQHGVGPVCDADFRTFEQWAEERDRLRTTRSLAVLSAVALGWLAVTGAAFWFRRQMA